MRFVHLLAVNSGEVATICSAVAGSASAVAAFLALRRRPANRWRGQDHPVRVDLPDETEPRTDWYRMARRAENRWTDDPPATSGLPDPNGHRPVEWWRTDSTTRPSSPPTKSHWWVRKERTRVP